MNKTCKVDGCNGKIRSKGYCNRHYLQMYKHGRIIDNDIRTCSVEGCNGKHHAKGYCTKHYQQIQKYGHILERTIRTLNEIIEYDDYAEIILYDNNNKEKARALIDLECVDLVKEYKWCLDNGYVYNPKVGKLHRFLMNAPEDIVIDHKNRNPLDNRLDNLRPCTAKENAINKSKQSNNTSGVTGVFWDKQKNRWRAQITLNGKTIRLGSFKELEEATKARRRAEIDYFGEYNPNIEG